MTHKVLIAGKWCPSQATGTFQAEDPKTLASLPGEYPVSHWDECSRALDAAVDAFEKMQSMPRERIAAFLERFADRIQARSEAICQWTARETGLPVEPRLASGELPRTTGQLRQAANACRTESWCLPTIDTATNIRSCYRAIGPVAVFGPNNFPLAFGSISGGDFAAAIASGNPVIAKANTMHPGATRLLGEEAHAACEDTGMPPGTVQLIYRLAHEDGERLVSDERLAAIGYTGSRAAGLKLKAAADAVGKPIYLELSSVNPIVILPAALRSRPDAIADEFQTSCLMGTGQFCTNPGLVILRTGTDTERWIASMAERFDAAAVGTLLSRSGLDALASSVEELVAAGAQVVCGGKPGGGEGYCYQNTLLTVTAERFLQDARRLQTEAFGNATLVLLAESVEQTIQVLKALEGNLTGSIYSDHDGEDEDDYQAIVPWLRQKVGRLMDDKMPTGVAVSPAMNHGGPYPATGHPGFSAVGIPASLVRFAMLQCYDNVRDHHLPTVLRDANRNGAFRNVDGVWSNASLET